ncbi:MAG: hypothetical protein AB8E82_08790 [Aureispira sp.]
MIEHFPWAIELAFFILAIVTVLLFYWSNARPTKITGLLFLWGGLHSLLAYNGFYENVTAQPPRFAFILIPGFVAIGYGLSPKALAWAEEHRNTRISTLLHTVRLPVELTLHYLFTWQLIPELMTYTGRNFDIIMGVTAPIVGYCYYKNKIALNILLVWNIVGLFLVSFILINGVLSAELPIQQFAFEQPNVALKYFPFVLLPALIVPLVIYTHLTDLIILRKLMKEVKGN